MSKMTTGDKIGLGGLAAAVVGILLSLCIPEVRCLLHLQSEVCPRESAKKEPAPSPSPSPNPSAAETPPPASTSPTPAKQPDVGSTPILEPPKTPLPVSPSPTPPKEPDVPSTPVPEAQNCNSSNIGVLKTTCSFSGRVSSDSQEKYYYFSLDKPSNVSLYLDKVTNEVGMNLYADTNGNGVIDSNERLASDSANSYRIGGISQILGADKYIVVINFRGGNSDYNLQLVNKTNEAVNVGLLKGTKTFSGSMNRNNRVKYYKFSLSSPSNVSLSLGKVTNEVGMNLYVDTNGNGVIDSNESLGSDSANNYRSGKISRTLGADNYFIIIYEKGGSTNYTLTMFSP